MPVGSQHSAPQLIRFGEAGQAIAEGLRDSGIESIAAWDILFPETDGARLKQAGHTVGTRVASWAADAVQGADIVVAAVTAASSVEAARSVAPHLVGNPSYLDINSVSPGRKQETARLLEGAARYVDVAILAPIHPARHRRADEMDQVAETLRELGIDPLMATATSSRQRDLGEIGKEPAVRSALKDGRAATLAAINAAAKDRH
jgi:3-hydroxyisobutyrate dehydrogenase-like beta-hydroxyacid dehydrogenase